jgi:hypothetical protein
MMIWVLDIFWISHKHLKCLLRYNTLIVMRSFEDWWRAVPVELQQKTRKGDEKKRATTKKLVSLSLEG